MTVKSGKIYLCTSGVAIGDPNNDDYLRIYAA